VDFELYSAPRSYQYWGQLAGPLPQASLSGVEVYADADGNDIVAVTDEFGRFGMTVAATDIVPISISSGPIGVHHHSIDIDANLPMQAAEAIVIAAPVEHQNMQVHSTLKSTGSDVPAGATVFLVGVKGDGTAIHQAEETMATAKVHDFSFEVPDGLSLHVVTVSDDGWGTTNLITPAVTPSVVVQDAGSASLEVTMLAEIGLVDPGELHLEVVISDAGTGEEFAIPFKSEPIVAGAPIAFSNLPQGEYRLRHISVQRDGFIDQFEVGAGEFLSKDYVITQFPETTLGLGDGIGTIGGVIAVTDPANTILTVTLIDPIDGRVEQSVTAAGDGSYLFEDVPAGDWTLTADGVHVSGKEFRMLEGAIEIGLATDEAFVLPVLGLTPSIGLAIRAYAVEVGAPELSLLPLDTFHVTLTDASGSTLTYQADEFNVLAIGDIPTSTVQIQVDGLQLGSHTFPVDFSSVDPNSFFKVYDVVVK